MSVDLYRYYDKNDVLLYVGISVNAVARLAQHRVTAPVWWKLWVRLAREQYDTRAQADAAEVQAIKNEKPLYNIVHNNSRRVLTEEEKEELRREKIRKAREARLHNLARLVETKSRPTRGNPSEAAVYNMSVAAQTREARRRAEGYYSDPNRPVRSKTVRC